ncbi:MAG: hypothetical protein GKS06_20380 [Acidobacteria bacterium]|nr:hypothetical protein [Acidobacteriota bacterium]
MRILAVAVFAAAALTVPAAPALAQSPTCVEPGQFDPAGTYEFDADMGGMPLSGLITVECSDEGLFGVIEPEGGMPGLEIVEVAIDGQQVVLSTEQMGGEGPDFVLDFEGDTFTGVVTFQGTEDAISGQRIEEES